MPKFAAEIVKNEHRILFWHRGYTEFKASNGERHLSDRRQRRFGCDGESGHYTLRERVSAKSWCAYILY